MQQWSAYWLPSAYPGLSICLAGTQMHGGQADLIRVHSLLAGLLYEFDDTLLKAVPPPLGEAYPGAPALCKLHA